MRTVLAYVSSSEHLSYPATFSSSISKLQFPSSFSVEKSCPPLDNCLPAMLSHAHTRNSEQLVMGVQRIERVDLWKNKARILQLRLRDRFRVAVDRHLNHRPEVFAEGYFSDTVSRIISRFRDFRRESLASPSAFYRKKAVSKELNAEEESVILRMVQAVAVPLLGNMCYVFMNGLNRVQVHGLDKLHKALLERPKGKPLVTVSNHVASVDDPFVIASLLPPSVLLEAQNLRWTLCASDRCFKNPVSSAFFKSVKVLPVSRGDGIYQKGMDTAIAKLNTGGWVHIFPEGSRSRDGGKTMGSIKRGVGRLILDSDTLPIVVPFVHTGMQEIMPIGSSLPKIGKTVTVLVGDPIYLDDLANTELEREDLLRGKLYDAVATRIGDRLQKMKATVEQLALQHSSPELLQQMATTTTDIPQLESSSAKDHEFRKSTLSNSAAQDSRFGTTSFVGRVSSRMAAYWDSTELVGFAARGLFSSIEAKAVDTPLRAWRRMIRFLLSSAVHVNVQNNADILSTFALNIPLIPRLSPHAFSNYIQFPSSSAVNKSFPPLDNSLPAMLSHAYTRNSEQLVMGVQRIERVDLWKNNVRILQLRLRDRFRVAVDRHLNHRPEVFADCYFSDTVSRLISRFRDFRREPLASPSAFCRKKAVSKELNAEEESVILRMVQAVAVPLLGNMCYVFMNGLNRVQVYGLEKLHKALLERPKDKPLVTVSNHVASVDDPFVIASLLPPRVLLDAQNLRWTLCASNRCFRNPVISALSKSVKVLPVSRGDGIYQKGMDTAIAKLNTGGWVHIFPEGRLSRDGGKTMGSIKRGVGRLILDSDTLPIVVPFVHTGMQEILPIGSILPKIGKTVTVLVGDPIYLDDLASTELEREDLPRGKLYDAVATRIGDRLQKMKATVEQLALQQHSSPELLQQMATTTTDIPQLESSSAKVHEFRKSTLSNSAAQDSRFGTTSFVGRVSSRMAAYWDSTELMGFAARGLFSSIEAKAVDTPLRAWRRYFERNLQQHLC
ncbi:tafazzin [Linum perenne]